MSGTRVKDMEPLDQEDPRGSRQEQDHAEDTQLRAQSSRLSRHVHLSGVQTPTQMSRQNGDNESIEEIFVDSSGYPNQDQSSKDDMSIWLSNLSPYTYKLQLNAAAHGPSATPISVRLETSGLSQSDTRNTSGTPVTPRPNTRGNGSEDGEAQETANEENKVFGAPPIGHFADFYTTDPSSHKDGNDGEDSDDDFDDGSGALYEDKFFFSDQKTLFGRIQGNLLPPPKHRITSEDNRKQAKNGFRIADHITKVPMSKLWHAATEIWAACVFLTNVIVAIVDIVRGPQNLQYKVTALVLSVVENIVLIGFWAISKHPSFKKSENYERRLKHFQYAENILHELLLYPLLILSIVGFATEKMYQKPGEAFGWVQLILLVLDTLELLYTQVVRMYMVYRFMRDIKKVLHPEEEDGRCCGKPFAGYVLWRASFTFVGNTVLLLIIATMLGVQSHKDNLTSSNYRASVESGLLMVCLILLPIFSLLLFVLANAYWILEIFIDLNLKVGGDAEFSHQLKEDYGEVVQGVVEFAQEKIPASTKRLEVIRSTSTSKKVLYGVVEIRIALLIFFYEILLFVALQEFNGFNTMAGVAAMRSVFLLVFVLANVHLVLLMLLSNLSVIIFVLCSIIYPLTIPLCCRKKHKVSTKYS